MRFCSAFILACVLLSALVVLSSAKEAGSTRGLGHLQRAVQQSQLEPHSLVATQASATVGVPVITVANDEEDQTLINEFNAAHVTAAAAVIAGRAAGAQFLTPALLAAARAAPAAPAAAAAPAPAVHMGAQPMSISPPSSPRNKFAKLFLEIEASIESEAAAEAETEVEAEAQVDATMSAYPVVALAGAGSCGALRNMIQADPAPLAINGFTYTIDNTGPALTHGRINSAHGTINAPITTRPAKAAVVEWCDVLYRATGAVTPAGALTFHGVAGTRTNVPPLPTGGNGGRYLWQSGHIIGFALGGSSDHPINFYPQIRSSNNAGGRWGRIEAIALQVAAACPAGSVGIDITFNAWDANGVYPMGGNYLVIIQPACSLALGVNCAFGAAAPAAWRAEVRVFCRHATPVAGFPAGTRRFHTQFSNDVNDVVGAAGRADAHFNP